MFVIVTGQQTIVRGDPSTFTLRTTVTKSFHRCPSVQLLCVIPKRRGTVRKKTIQFHGIDAYQVPFHFEGPYMVVVPVSIREMFMLYYETKRTRKSKLRSQPATQNRITTTNITYNPTPPRNNVTFNVRSFR